MERRDIPKGKSFEAMAQEIRDSMLCGRCATATFQFWNAARENEVGFLYGGLITCRVRCDYFRSQITDPENMLICEAFQAEKQSAEAKRQSGKSERDAKDPKSKVDPGK